MEAQGKWGVMAILGVAVVLATFGWWWNLQRSKRCLEFWGPEHALVIRQGDQAQAFQLASEDKALPPLGEIKDGETTFVIVGENDISAVRGLIHARNSLLDDASFAWNAEAADKPVWTHALQFKGKADPNKDEGTLTEVTVLFDLQHAYLKQVGQPRVLRLVPQSTYAWHMAFGDRYFKDPQLVPQELPK